MKKVLQVISFVLVVTLILQIAPVTVSRVLASEAVDDSAPMMQTAEEAEIVCEEVEKREENVKHFRLSDGSYLAAQYDVPVHYEDENGVWQEYDNRLSLIENRSTEENQEYAVRSNNLELKLAKKAKAQNMFRVKNGAYELTWGYQGSNKSRIEVVETADDGDHLSLHNLYGESFYRNLYTNVDLQVFTTPEGIKENLILKEASAQSSFVLNYHHAELTPVQIDSRTIVLRDAAGADVFWVTAPVVSDAEGKSSADAVTLTLGSTEDGKSVITLSVSDDWLADAVYPVAIDPTVAIPRDESNIIGLTITSAGSHTNTSVYYVGNNAGGQAYRTLLKFDLPELDGSDRMTGAYLDLTATMLNNVSVQYFQVSRVTESWSASTTWATKPAVYTEILDRQKMRAGDIRLDLSEYVYNWYLNELDSNLGYANFGIVLSDIDEAASSGPATLSIAATQNANAASRPLLTVTYVSANGVESRYSYDSRAVGTNGIASVNLFTGMLTVQETLFAESGNRMPLSIALTYNSTEANKYIFYDGVAGKGNRLSFQQVLIPLHDYGDVENPVFENEPLNVYHYVWIDGDGTEHYFKEKKNKSVDSAGNITTETVPNSYVDEDGYGLTLRVENDRYYLETATGSGCEFEPVSIGVDGYRLIRQYDTFGNEIVYHYSNGPSGVSRVSSIADGAGRVTNLQYAAGASGKGLLQKIITPDQREILFAYDENDRLVTITYPGNVTTTYTYNDSGLMSIAASSLTNTRACFGYVNAVNRVRFLEFESHDGVAPGVKGSHTEYTYGAQNTDKNGAILSTKVSYLVQKNADTLGNAIETVYTFDTAGRAVSVIGDDGYQETVTYTTEAEIAENPILRNKLTAQSAGTDHITNLLANSSAENALSGNFVTAPSANGTQSIESDTATSGGEKKQFLGQKSFKISNSSSTEYKTGYYAQTYTLPSHPADVYTFSAYVKSYNIVPADDENATHGGVLYLAFYDASGTLLSTHYSPAITGSNKWQRLDVQGSVPANAVTLKVFVGLNQATGTLWADCLQLEEGDTANPYNMLENSEFASTKAWTTSGFVSGVDSFDGSDEVNVVGAPNAAKHIMQEVAVGKADLPVFVSARADANAAPIHSSDTGQSVQRAFGIVVSFLYEDTTLSDVQYLPFDDTSSALQQISGTFVPKFSGEIIRSIQYALVYYDNVNTANFYTAMMSFDVSGANYQYEDHIYTDENGHRKVGTKTTTTDYTGDVYVTLLDANNMEYEAEDAEGRVSKTFYNDDYSVAATRTADDANDTYGIGNQYQYDAYGNVTQTRYGLVNQNGSMEHNLSMRTFYVYDSTGNYLVSVSDVLGNTTTYDVNTLNGLTNSVTDPNGNETEYTYDSVTHLLTGIASGNAENEYAYNSKMQLVSITHNGFDYTFTYDRWGRTGLVKIGSRTLNTNTYDAATRRLTQSVYGNNSKITYTYDRYGRVVEATRFGKKLSLVYNQSGQVARETDSGEQTVTRYYYDLDGKLSNSRTTGGREGWALYEYDNLNRLTQVNGKNFLIDYTFSLDYNADGTVQKASGNGVQSSYTYDDHQRVTQIKTTAGSHLRNMLTSFTYQSGMVQSDGPTTTNRISKITYSAAGNSDVLTFTYDANGNILTEKLNNAAYHAYTYDGLNQLVREDNAAAGKTWVYTYDSAGNILSKTEYAYTTAADLSSLTPVDVITYTYGDSEWKDLLTAYDGQAITYDEIGNPLNYRGRQMYWSGRDLTAVVASGSAVQFNYNAAGQRISKIYGPNTTKFYYDDSGNLIGMRKGYEQPIKFQVNYATGEIDGFVQGTETYWFRKNQQGDVTGIFNTSYGGTELFVEYEYDAWGNVISISGVGADTIGQTNPIRYRGYFYDTETGFYYLNSRYYDPTVGRFLNGDVYASTGQGVLGCNMFAYCLNNPVNSVDLDGQTTVSIGLSVSAFMLGGATYAIFISFDNDGNIVLQTSEADVTRKTKGGTFGLAAAGVSLFGSFTDLDSVYDLEGWAQSTGGTISEPFAFEIITNPETGELLGHSTSVGKGYGFDPHITIADTNTIAVIKEAPSYETTVREKGKTVYKNSNKTRRYIMC